MADDQGRTPGQDGYERMRDPEAGSPQSGYIWHAAFARWGSPSAAERFGGDMGLVKISCDRNR